MQLERYPRAPHLLAVLMRKAGMAPELLPLLAEPARAAVQVSSWGGAGGASVGPRSHQGLPCVHLSPHPVTRLCKLWPRGEQMYH